MRNPTDMLDDNWPWIIFVCMSPAEGLGECFCLETVKR